MKFHFYKWRALGFYWIDSACSLRAYERAVPLKVLLHWWLRTHGYLAAIERRLRRPLELKRYVVGVYTFTATPPFRPLWMTPAPLLHPAAERPYQRRVRANPCADGIVYPCGAIPWGNERWLVSYGVHDERCCLRCIALA